MKKTWTGTINNEEIILTMETDDDVESPREWENLGTMICFSNRYNWGDKHGYSTPRHFLEELAAESLDNHEAKAIVDKALEKAFPHELKQNGDNEYYWHATLEHNVFEDETYETEEEAEERMEEAKEDWENNPIKELSYEELKQIIRTKHVLLPIYVYQHSGTSMSTTPFSCEWDSGQAGFIYASKQRFLDETGYTEDELFSTDTKRTPVVGNRVRIKNQTIRADEPFRTRTFGLIKSIEDGMATIDFDAGYIPSARKPEHLVTVPLSEIDEVLSNQAEEMLKSEIEIYDQYLNGDVYWFKIEKVVKCDCCNHVTYEEIDSCGGFYGDDPFTNGMIDQMGSEYRVLFDKVEA